MHLKKNEKVSRKPPILGCLIVYDLADLDELKYPILIHMLRNRGTSASAES